MLLVYGSAFNNGDLDMILGRLNYEGRSCRSDQVAFAPSINDMMLLMCADNCTVTQSSLLPERYESYED